MFQNSANLVCTEFSEVACISPVLKGRRIADCPGPLLLDSGRGVAQLVSCADVYVLDFYEEVRVVGALIRWLFRLLLFRVLVGLWRMVRRR
jgi:hypothetical protein